MDGAGAVAMGWVMDGDYVCWDGDIDWGDGGGKREGEFDRPGGLDKISFLRQRIEAY